MVHISDWFPGRFLRKEELNPGRRVVKTPESRVTNALQKVDPDLPCPVAPQAGPHPPETPGGGRLEAGLTPKPEEPGRLLPAPVSETLPTKLSPHQPTRTPSLFPPQGQVSGVRAAGPGEWSCFLHGGVQASRTPAQREGLRVEIVAPEGRERWRGQTLTPRRHYLRGTCCTGPSE